MDPFEFNRLFPDLRWEVVMKMSDPELINLCRSSHAVETFCNTKDWFWKERIQTQFGMVPDELGEVLRERGNWFRVYFLLVKLNKLKNKLRPYLNRYNLLELYNRESLYLLNTNLRELPKEIGELHNLKKLGLDNNNLTELPKEIGLLQNLTWLRLNDNNLTELPSQYYSCQPFDS